MNEEEEESEEEDDDGFSGQRKKEEVEEDPVEREHDDGLDVDNVDDDVGGLFPYNTTKRDVKTTTTKRSKKGQFKKITSSLFQPLFLRGKGPC